MNKNQELILNVIERWVTAPVPYIIESLMMKQGQMFALADLIAFTQDMQALIEEGKITSTDFVAPDHGDMAVTLYHASHIDIEAVNVGEQGLVKVVKH